MEKGLVDDDIGAVIIGRNEGERFKRCLSTVKASTNKVIYVDSGSTDDSVAHAKSQGILTTELDLSVPFSAGRARNEGFAALLAQYPELKWVQFIDGDCELEPGWLATAKTFLEQNPRHAIACGRRAEKAPHATIYNRLCDIEWDTPVGTAYACGGDFMIRAAAFTMVGGFNNSVIAGEEPEMCFRLRAKGMKIERLDSLMTHHDAQLTRFGQWWSRAKRCGHAYAQGEDLHGKSPEGYYRREVRSTIVWGAIVPFVLALNLVAVILGAPVFLLVVFLLPFLLAAKVTKFAMDERGSSAFDGAVYGLLTVTSKVAECLGVCLYYARKGQHKNMEIIEYK